MLDSDIVACNLGILKTVSQTLDNCDITQAQSFQYYVNEPEKSEHSENGLFSSLSHHITAQNDYKGHPGFSIAFTRNFYDTYGGFNDPPHRGDDNWFWICVFGTKKRKITQYSHFNPCFFRRWGIFPEPKVAETNEIVCHIPHGKYRNRQYISTALLCRWSNTEEHECTIYDPKKPYILPKWKNNYAAKTLNKSLDLLYKNELSFDTKSQRISARNAYDEAAMEIYGKIDEEHPLYVVSLLHSNGVDFQKFDAKIV